METTLLIVAGVLATLEWVTVAERLPASLRWLTKPGTMVVLIAAAVVADAGGAVRTWFVVGLVLSLAGDVFLMLSERWFVAGLGSFLVAHIAFVVAMAQLDLTAWAAIPALVAVVVVWVLVGRPLVEGAARQDRAMRIPVTLYVAVISTMLVVAATTTEPWLIAGAASFFVSDAVLGTNRFVQPRRWMPVTVMVTYHVAQFCFVAFLLSR